LTMLTCDDDCNRNVRHPSRLLLNLQHAQSLHSGRCSFCLECYDVSLPMPVPCALVGLSRIGSSPRLLQWTASRFYRAGVKFDGNNPQQLQHVAQPQLVCGCHCWATVRVGTCALVRSLCGVVCGCSPHVTIVCDRVWVQGDDSCLLWAHPQSVLVHSGGQQPGGKRIAAVFLWCVCPLPPAPASHHLFPWRSHPHFPLPPCLPFLPVAPPPYSRSLPHVGPPHVDPPLWGPACLFPCRAPCPTPSSPCGRTCTSSTSVITNSMVCLRQRWAVCVGLLLLF
jgi:hypothetical protein